MPRKKIEGICKAEGCTKPLKSLGLCVNHYAMFWKYGRTYKLNVGGKRGHPLYHLWFERKQTNSLVDEWHKDFWKFVAAISPRPEGNYLLVRLRAAPYGPDNFKWQEHLKRRADETKKEWWARKRRARIANIPSMERRRELKRRYGLTLEQHAELEKAHNNKCAICGRFERSFDARTGTRKRLAVDHNHTTGKVRGLLCWDCNSCIGKAEESIPRLEAMISYLRKHECQSA